MCIFEATFSLLQLDARTTLPGVAIRLSSRSEGNETIRPTQKISAGSATPIEAGEGAGALIESLSNGCIALVRLISLPPNPN